jgi:hypothetical protein
MRDERREMKIEADNQMSQPQQSAEVLPAHGHFDYGKWTVNGPGNQWWPWFYR